ncbi:Histidine-specific methyltransferase EgtD [Botrimarina colliarenosi]|uniref:Histidine-specific methyltransferase EgtD n=1 Tax=Botrimarina colliarenosi TaxID=2528001 RepID=A0A5C6ALP2_9BACT|nr:L-histidine N(alpha)-methyltransferase [Botrimarina colliarenosi]TWU00189.1 Histidine-specific methyltransferase EgtD [Botrimarina colliarenosi]
MTALATHPNQQFLSEVRAGLSRPQKRLPCKYFYDQRGSELFDQICELDEYYPTRTELTITRRYAAEMAEQIGPRAALVEYGSGSSLKTRLLLDELIDPIAYVPVEICESHLVAAAERIGKRYPLIDVLPVCTDFTQAFALPTFPRMPSHAAAYFPGSTIGNFPPEAARRLLASIRQTVGAGGGAILGIDLQKPVKVLEAAYNDAAGVTAAFNLNLLERINRELDANFSLDDFEHRADYDPEHGRIDMLLVAQREHEVEIAGEPVRFRRGETIHTEHSHKYTLDGFTRLAARAGLTVRKAWTDPRDWFAVVHLVAE